MGLLDLPPEILLHIITLLEVDRFPNPTRASLSGACTELRQLVNDPHILTHIDFTNLWRTKSELDPQLPSLLDEDGPVLGVTLQQMHPLPPLPPGPVVDPKEERRRRAVREAIARRIKPFPVDDWRQKLEEETRRTITRECHMLRFVLGRADYITSLRLSLRGTSARALHGLFPSASRSDGPTFPNLAELSIPSVTSSSSGSCDAGSREREDRLLQAVARNSPQLERLFLAHWKNVSFTAFASVLGALPNLRVLNLAGTSCHGWEAAKSNDNPALPESGLQYLALQTQDHSATLARLLHQLPSLVMLSLAPTYAPPSSQKLDQFSKAIEPAQLYLGPKWSVESGDYAGLKRQVMELGMDPGVEGSPHEAVLLGLAIARKDLEMVRLLVELGANPRTKEPVWMKLDHLTLAEAALKNEDEAMLRLLVKQYRPYVSPDLLRSAVRDVRCLAFLCKYGQYDVDIRDEQGNGILAFIATAEPTEEELPLLKEVIQRLMKRGIDINQRNRFFATPIWIAAQAGRLAVARLLMQLGANPVLRSTARNAYQIALEEKHHDVAQFLSAVELGVKSGRKG